MFESTLIRAAFSAVILCVLPLLTACGTPAERSLSILHEQGFEDVSFLHHDGFVYQFQGVKDGKWCSGHVRGAPLRTSAWVCDALDAPACDPRVPSSCASRAIAMKPRNATVANGFLTDACLHGHTNACGGWTGGLEKSDYDELRLAFAVGCGRGNATACLRHGRSEYIAGRHAYAARLFDALCTSGDAEACEDLAGVYDMDDNTRTDPTVPLRRACALGSTTACEHSDSDS